MLPNAPEFHEQMQRFLYPSSEQQKILMGSGGGHYINPLDLYEEGEWLPCRARTCYRVNHGFSD